MGWSVVGALMLGCRICGLNGFDSLALACVLCRVVDCLRRLLEDIAPMMSLRAHMLIAMLCIAACLVFSTIALIIILSLALPTGFPSSCTLLVFPSLLNEMRTLS